MKSTYNFFPDHCPEEPKQKWGKRLNTHFRRESKKKKKIEAHQCCSNVSNYSPERSQFMHVTMVLEKTLESPLDCKEIQPVHPKGDQSRVFIGRTDAESETPILWPYM